MDIGDYNRNKIVLEMRVSYNNPWVIISVIIFLVFCWHAINFAWDDPFISFRYAENLASGKGLVFNEGQKVEGYTNLLWVLIFASFWFLGFGKYELGLLIAAKIIGFITAIISSWLIVKAYYLLSPYRKIECNGRSNIISSYFAIIPLMLMLTNIYYAVWTVGALETTFFAFLVLIANIIVLGDITGDAFYKANVAGSKERVKIYRPIMAGFVFFLIAITRADGFIIFVSAFPAMTIFAGLKRLEWKYILLSTFVFLALSFLVLGWRFWYYGDIFPNTY